MITEAQGEEVIGLLRQLVAESDADKLGINRAGQVYRKAIPAGESKQLSATGNRYYFVECPEDLIVRTDFGAENTHQVGTGITFGAKEIFRELMLKNDTAEDQTVEIFVGFNNFIDNRLNVVEGRLSSIITFLQGATTLIASSVTSIPNAGSETFDGVPPSAAYARRRALIITNEDPNNELDWSDGSNIGGKIFAEQNLILETSGSVTIENSSGGAITCKISELWYDAV